jgi:hypothetical protein
VKAHLEMAVYTLPESPLAGAAQQLFFLLLKSSPIISIGAADASPERDELLFASDNDQFEPPPFAARAAPSAYTRICARPDRTIATLQNLASGISSRA